MRQLKALDLFCGAGGSAKGLQQAGFHVTGVDINHQPRYCGDVFIRGDALTFPLDGYDLRWISPVCKLWSSATRTARSQHRWTDQIGEMRERLERYGAPYIIENVVGAPLRNPILLCGAMFGLRTYRHRLFESNILLLSPPHLPHKCRVTKMGRPLKDGEYMSIVGNFSGVAQAREIMGIDWMNQHELAQAIPPAYSHSLGLQVARMLSGQELVAS